MRPESGHDLRLDLVSLRLWADHTLRWRLTGKRAGVGQCHLGEMEAAHLESRSTTTTSAGIQTMYLLSVVIPCFSSASLLTYHVADAHHYIRSRVLND